MIKEVFRMHLSQVLSTFFPFIMVMMSLITEVFDALPSVLMSLLLDLVSLLDIPCKKVWELKTSFYAQRIFQSAFILSFECILPFFWADGCIAGILDDRSSH